MKLFKISVLLNVAVSLNCYECRGKTYLDCEQSKELVTCEENEEVCQLSIRKRDGVIEKVRINQIRNFKFGYFEFSDLTANFNNK